GPPAVTDLLAKKVDFAIAGDFVGVNNIFKNGNLRILSQVSEQESFHILARKDKGINQPSDLKGKTVGVTFNGAGQFFLYRYLSLHDMKATDIKSKNLTPDQMTSQITDGKIDAIVIFEPHVYDLQKSLGDKIVNWSAQGSELTSALAYTTQP